MQLRDILRYALRALGAHRLRCVLMLVAMGIGVASVVLLTALGDGARRFVLDEFAALGTNLLIVVPGRSETTGAAPPLMGETPRDLTIDDAVALLRNTSIARIAPINVGAAAVSFGAREREATIIGSTHDFLHVRNLTMRRGSFLPPLEPDRAAAVCVLGETIRAELFGAREAVGEQLRVGDRRFRVVGVVGSSGESIGLDLDEMVVIPIASAQQLFDTSSLFRIMIEARRREDLPRAEQAILATIRARHDGEDDVTVIRQDSVLGTFDKILRALTFAVAGIAAISLIVAGILIQNVMLVAVSQRTTEIGLLKALGAPPRRILAIFLTEAVALAAVGASCGVLVGEACVFAMRAAFPRIPAAAPWWAIGAALVVAIGAGVVFGILPARRAARLDPVQALARR